MGVKKGRGTVLDLFLRLLVVKMDLNVVSHNVAVYKNVSTTLDLNEIGPTRVQLLGPS
jgi:hypothetical protein